MNDWNKLVLGEEDSQTAPVCNGTVREMIADIDRLKRYENIYRREFEAKQQLKAAEFEITELDGALSEVKRQLDASQALLAEARAEIKRWKVIKWVQTESYEAVAAVEQARQEAAREILHIISMETMDRPFEQSQAAEIIKAKFKLEG